MFDQSSKNRPQVVALFAQVAISQLGAGGKPGHRQDPRRALDTRSGLRIRRESKLQIRCKLEKCIVSVLEK
eukprot:8846768-Pyramimonas_sp.AAC.1